jgi:histidinol-phosphatase (PHP family)
MITIGSDSHNAASIGGSFDVAKTISENAGLRIVYFKERKPEYIRP